jgi:hypothetical protein
MFTDWCIAANARLHRFLGVMLPRRGGPCTDAATGGAATSNMAIDRRISAI